MRFTAEAKSFLPEKKKKNRGRSVSRASFEAIDIDDIIVVSDDDEW